MLPEYLNSSPPGTFFPIDILTYPPICFAIPLFPSVYVIGTDWWAFTEKLFLYPFEYTFPYLAEKTTYTVWLVLL